MPEIKPFDTSQYLRAPRLDVPQAFALAVALLHALPKAAGVGVHRAAKALNKVTVALQILWSARERALTAEKPFDKVVVDNRVDTAWGALKLRISSYAMLPPALYPLAARAEVLDKSLFPRGMTFLKDAMEAEWAASDELLKRIDTDHLAVEIDTIAGADFLIEIRAAHLEYGQALGITEAHGAVESVEALLPPLRAVTQAIADYALQIVATVDREDAASIKVARDALLPMDRYREGAARRASKGGKAAEEPEPEVKPDTPVPEVPDLDVK
jgi:hypothetical protein